MFACKINTDGCDLDSCMFFEILKIKSRARPLLWALLLSVTTALLAWLDLNSSPHLTFAVFYYLDIFAAALLVEGWFPYALAMATAASRAYGVMQGYPADEPDFAKYWLVASNMCLHGLACYMFHVVVRLKEFLSPGVYPYIKDELPLVKRFVLSPYVSSKWGFGDRMMAMANHYRLIGAAPPFWRIPQDDCKDVLSIECEGGTLRVVVDRPGWMRGEGEIAISLFWNVDRIYTAMVMLGEADDGQYMLIGALQGDGRERKDLYKQLTKTLHGLRPRDFLLDITKMMAACTGCTYLMAVSDATHRSNHPLTRAKKGTGYNQVWVENGGVLDRKTGLFVMPVHTEQRTMEDIPSHKRAMYRRRYEMLSDLRMRVEALLGQSCLTDKPKC